MGGAKASPRFWLLLGFDPRFRSCLGPCLFRPLRLLRLTKGSRKDEFPGFVLDQRDGPAFELSHAVPSAGFNADHFTRFHP